MFSFFIKINELFQLDLKKSNIKQTRDPNEGPYSLNVKWPSWDAENKNYLEACFNAKSKQNTEFGDKLKFWTERIPTLLQSF